MHDAGTITSWLTKKSLDGTAVLIRRFQVWKFEQLFSRFVS